MDSLGRSIRRSQRAALRGSRLRHRGAVAAAEAGGGLRSVWETTGLAEFLLEAEAREERYEAARDLRVVVDGAPHVVERDRVVPLSDARVDWLRLSARLPIPRRPHWTYAMRAEEVQATEKGAFLAWRRELARLEEQHRAVISPYEKNLEVWRQLWRVVERSDLVLFILDARNPLVFRCADFERYVRGTQNAAGEAKEVMYLLNKADLLTAAQRQAWAAHFTAHGHSFVFFSARPAPPPKPDPRAENNPRDDDSAESDGETAESAGEEELDGERHGEDISAKPAPAHRPKRRGGRKALRAPIALAHPYELSQRRRADAKNPKAPPPPPRPPTADETARDMRAAMGFLQQRDPAAVADAAELLDILAARRTSTLAPAAPLLVGLVGYPNVGKSSTINALLGAKRVVVSATPGKTRHLQTLAIPHERRVALCDCPGLVFPSLASTRAQMLCDGILPVDTSVDAAAAVTVVCRRVPRAVLEMRFRVSLSGERDVPAAEQLLAAVAERRGYMGAHGRPDRGRAARDILRMFVEGAIVYAEPPPGYTVHTKQEAKGEGTKKEGEEKEEEEEEEEKEEEWEDAEEWEDVEDDDAWDDLESAEDARALSDADDAESVDNNNTSEKHTSSPLFYDRTKGPMTREETFNAEANKARMEVVEEAPKRHRRTNHQLEPDYETFVNAEGEVELCIDDDDGIMQVDMPGTLHASGIKEEGQKRKSKRQMRREEKRSGGAVHENPTTRRVGVLGYGNI